MTREEDQAERACVAVEALATAQERANVIAILRLSMDYNHAITAWNTSRCAATDEDIQSFAEAMNALGEQIREIKEQVLR